MNSSATSTTNGTRRLPLAGFLGLLLLLASGCGGEVVVERESAPAREQPPAKTDDLQSAKPAKDDAPPTLDDSKTLDARVWVVATGTAGASAETIHTEV